MTTIIYHAMCREGSQAYTLILDVTHKWGMSIDEVTWALRAHKLFRDVDILRIHQVSLGSEELGMADEEITV